MKDGTITRNIFGLSSKGAEGMSFRASGGNYDIMTPQEAKMIGKKTGKKLDEFTPGAEPPTETTEVKKIRLVTPLDAGSANLGDTQLQLGLVFGRKYTFEVESYTNKPPRDLSSIKWVMRYHSLKDNTWKEWDAKAKGNKVVFEFNEPDLCGRFFHLKAYINNKESVEFEKTWHHNRFRYFDKKTVYDQIAERMAQPWRIQQGGTSLCGMAALFYAMIKKDSGAYETLAKNLFRTGEHTIGSYTFKTHEKAQDMYDRTPASIDGMHIYAADWIVMATARSKESLNNQFVYKGTETGSIDQLKAVNWPEMLTNMCKNVGVFGSAVSYGLSKASIAAKKAPISGRTADFLFDTDLRALQQIDTKYKAGKQILLMIDADMIDDEGSYYSVVDIGRDSHWVVYEGGLEFFDKEGNATTDLGDVKSLKFQIFTWGRNPTTSVYRRYTDGKEYIDSAVTKFRTTGIKVKSFKSNYYGYIEVS